MRLITLIIGFVFGLAVSLSVGNMVFKLIEVSQIIKDSLYYLLGFVVSYLIIKSIHESKD